MRHAMQRDPVLNGSSDVLQVCEVVGKVSLIAFNACSALFYNLRWILLEFGHCMTECRLVAVHFPAFLHFKKTLNLVNVHIRVACKSLDDGHQCGGLRGFCWYDCDFVAHAFLSLTSFSSSARNASRTMKVKVTFPCCFIIALRHRTATFLSTGLNTTVVRNI